MARRPHEAVARHPADGLTPGRFALLQALEMCRGRRCRSGEIERKMREAGLAGKPRYCFKRTVVLTCSVGNKLSGQKTITSWQLKLYNALTPLFRILDHLAPPNGLSAIVGARKPAPASTSAPAPAR